MVGYALNMIPAAVEALEEGLKRVERAAAVAPENSAVVKQGGDQEQVQAVAEVAGLLTETSERMWRRVWPGMDGQDVCK